MHFPASHTPVCPALKVQRTRSRVRGREAPLLLLLVLAHISNSRLSNTRKATET